MSNINLVEAIEPRVLLSAGQLDHSFGDGGLVALSRNTAAADVFPLADGTLLVVGNRDGVYVRRLTARGQIDPTFPEAQLRRALRPIASGVGAAAVDGNQRLLLMSGTSIIRVTARGSIDRTFGKNGVSNIPLESLDTMAVLSDGRIVVAGTIGTTPYDPDSDP